MKNKKWENKLLYIILTLLLLMWGMVLSAQEKRVGNPNNSDIYGEWVSMDGDQKLWVNYRLGKNNTFLRQSPQGPVTGEFRIEDSFIVVTREHESYRLMFYLNGVRLIVVKPESDDTEGEAWVFQKVSNKQTEY
tara:strand:+ start:164 stop:565 length:402 start_codon:yes stop_codon:yes gene_type:complete